MGMALNFVAVSNENGSSELGVDGLASQGRARHLNVDIVALATAVSGAGVELRPFVHGAYAARQGAAFWRMEPRARGWSQQILGQQIAVELGRGTSGS